MNIMKIDWKKILPELAIVAVFLLASAIYFWPAVQGKIIYAGDGINGRAAVQESVAFHEQTGEYTYWTNSMFGGMPNYQIGGNGGFKIDKILRPCKWFFSWGNRNTVFIFFFYLIAFFLLLRSFRVNKWLSMAGAFAIALSSYFFVIIGAMHHGKCYSITWMTLVVIGFLLIYRKQYGWGALMVMFFTYIGFFLHPQMSYYICMLIGVLFFAEIALAYQQKEWKHFGIASLIFFASFAVGMGMGSGNIFANQEYAEQTMRGGHSDLVKETDATNKTKGLDLDYATAWSYGINETMTFLIPNYMGGASGYNVGNKSVLYDELVKARVPKSSAKQFCSSAPTYWGEKAFTSGPVYIGAIICFLFLLALIIVPGPYKWALLVATIFSVLLAWGKHFLPFTEFFFKYFPVYNKFRAVESILIVAEITMPLLALLGLKQLSDTPEADRKKYLRPLYISAGVTAGICLIFALFGGSICSFTSSYDAQWKGQVGEDIYRMIIDQRAAMMTADAWRSFAFIAAAAALLVAYVYKPFKTLYLGLALTGLIVLDMWPVDKRFCNDSYFRPAKNVYSAFNMRPVEKQLKEHDNGYYRVLDLSTNTFNDARLSYHFHSIGGYSAAKLRRYQDLIDEHISRMNWSVLNMLNTKYLIVKGKDNQPNFHYNPDAFGPCWTVDSIVWVSNANEESDALRHLDLRHIAVADSTFGANKSLIGSAWAKGSNKAISLEKYQPNELRYQTHTSEAQLAVLSEIYYPYGWKAWIDDQPVDIYRVNYMLRAVLLPAGEHQLVLRFEPDAVRKGDLLSLTCLALMLLTLLGVCGWKLYAYRKRAA